jgi:hypothetical protein
VINLEDATMVEKHGRGRPRGSKNKSRASTIDASSSNPVKRRHGCPVGNKNKPKTSTAPTSCPDYLDVSLVQPILPQSSDGNIFSVFAFVGAQCNQQRLPLIFTEFMEGREQHKAIL